MTNRKINKKSSRSSKLNIKSKKKGGSNFSKKNLLVGGAEVTETTWFKSLQVVHKKLIQDVIKNKDKERSLELQDEEFKTIPEEIFTEMVSLTSLNLISCSSLSTLPESIGQLTSLTELELPLCTNLSTLPESIGDLSSLKILGLDRCRHLSTLPNSIGNLSSLRSLYMTQCSTLLTLPESIGNLSSLEELDLSRCLTLQTLPESIGNLSSLKKLDLGNCRSLSTLPESIGNLNSLESLNMEQCTSLSLPESIGELSSLRHLKLGNFSLQKLPKSIGNLLELKVLLVPQNEEDIGKFANYIIDRNKEIVKLVRENYHQYFKQEGCENLQEFLKHTESELILDENNTELLGRIALYFNASTKYNLDKFKEAITAMSIKNMLSTKYNDVKKTWRDNENSRVEEYRNEDPWKIPEEVVPEEVVPEEAQQDVYLENSIGNKLKVSRTGASMSPIIKEFLDKEEEKEEEIIQEEEIVCPLKIEYFQNEKIFELIVNFLNEYSKEPLENINNPLYKIHNIQETKNICLIKYFNLIQQLTPTEFIDLFNASTFLDIPSLQELLCYSLPNFLKKYKPSKTKIPAENTHLPNKRDELLESTMFEKFSICNFEQDQQINRILLGLL